MVKVAIFNGKPACGKTTFQKLCIRECFWGGIHSPSINITSTVDFVKEIAKECGWDGSKDLKNRKFLSDLKDLLTEWDDIPYKKIIERANILAEMPQDFIMFVDCREPTEIEKLKQGLNATTVLIRRPEVENEETSNHADAEVFNYNYDLTIWNNSDIMNLENEAKKFLNFMKGVPHYEHDNRRN